MKILVVLAAVAIAIQFLAAPVIQLLADAVGLAGFAAWSWWDGLGRE